MKWLEKNQIRVDPPKKPKRITGTRFASILGLDRWNTEFKTWCAITRTYEEPFIENKYTRAGKAIEPKIIDYLNNVYFFGDLKSATDIYGPDYFKKTWGNFFPDEKIFGGMWDALCFEKDKPNMVIEIKTTKRVEDWKDGAPDYYALQAALYAYLLGLDDVVMVCAFLEDKNYERPEDFIPYAGNTIIDEFSISERFPQFQAHIERAMEWWDKHVITGISPFYDEKKDKDILKELRKNKIEVKDDIEKLVLEGEILKNQIDIINDSIKDKVKRFDEIKKAIRSHCNKQFRDGDTRVAIAGQSYEWVLSKSIGSEIDKKALKKDGLLKKYTKEKINYRFTQSAIEEKEEPKKAEKPKIAGRNAYYFDPKGKKYRMVEKGSPIPEEAKDWEKILKREYYRELKEEST